MTANTEDRRASLIELGPAEIMNFVASQDQRLKILVFTIPKCEPCVSLMSVIGDIISSDQNAKIASAYIDASKLGAQEFDDLAIRHFPTLYLFDHMNCLAIRKGWTPALYKNPGEKLRQWISKKSGEQLGSIGGVEGC